VKLDNSTPTGTAVPSTGRSSQSGTSRSQIQSGLAYERTKRSTKLAAVDEEKEYEGSDESEEEETGELD
jgi:hypothetical protein